MKFQFMLRMMFDSVVVQFGSVLVLVDQCWFWFDSVWFRLVQCWSSFGSVLVVQFWLSSGSGLYILCYVGSILVLFRFSFGSVAVQVCDHVQAHSVMTYCS